MSNSKKISTVSKNFKRVLTVFVLSIFTIESLLFNIAAASANFEELSQALDSEAGQIAIDQAEDKKDISTLLDQEKAEVSEVQQEQDDYVDTKRDDKLEKKREVLREEVVDLELFVPRIKKVYPNEVSALKESLVYLDVENYSFNFNQTQNFYYDFLSFFAFESAKKSVPTVKLGDNYAQEIQVVDENTISFVAPALTQGRYEIQVITEDTKLESREELTYSGENSLGGEVLLDEDLKEDSSFVLESHESYSYANRFGYGTSLEQVEILGFRFEIGQNPVQVNSIYFNTASSGITNGDLNYIQLIEDEDADGRISPEENLQYGDDAIPSLQNNTIYIPSSFSLLANRTYYFILRANVTNLVNQDFLSIGLLANNQAINVVSLGQPVNVSGTDIKQLKHFALGTPNLRFLGVTGSSLDFGNFPFDSSRLTFSARTVALENIGDTDVNVNNINLGNNVFLNDTALDLPFSLKPNQVKNLVLGFNPATSGTVSTTLSIQGATPTEGTNLELSLTGVSQNSTDLISSLSSNLISYDFGEFLADLNEETYSSYPLVLKNNGTANLTVNNLTISNNVFSLESNLTGVIKPGESKEALMKFNPRNANNFSSSLQISYQGTNGSQNLNLDLRGAGVDSYEKGKLKISPSFLNFEKRQIGTEARKNIRITNTGTANLTLQSLTNPSLPFRVLNNNLPINLAAGAYTDLTFVFAPDSNVISISSVNLLSTDSNEPKMKIVLVGEGVNEANPIIETIKTKDQNENGKIDAIEIIFSEPMDTTKTSTAGFTVQNFTILSNGIYENNKTFKLLLNEDLGGTELTPTVSYLKATGVIQDLLGNKLDDVTLKSTDSARPVITFAKIFDDGLLNKRETGVDEDDYIEILWSESTNKYPITAQNINSIIQLRSGVNVHNWGTVTTSWVSANKLMVYLSTEGNATIADSDSIYVQPSLQLKDLADNYASGVFQLSGSLSPSAKPLINTLSFSSGVVPNGVSSTTLTVSLSDLDGMGNIKDVLLNLAPVGGKNLLLSNVAPSYLAPTGIFINSNVTVNSGFKPGTVALTVTVTDKQGFTDSKNVNLQILNAEPKVNNVSYVPGQGMPGQSNFNLTVNVTDLNTIGDLQAVRANMSVFSGFSSSVALSLTTSPSSTQGTYVLSGGFSIPKNTPAGSYTFPITVIDKQGSGETSMTGIFIVQNVSPEITATSITPQKRKPGENATAQATITDGNGLSDISTVTLNLSSILTASGVSMTTNVLLTPTSVAGVYSNNAISAPVGTPAGTYTLPLTVKDKAGNTAVTSSILLNIEDVPVSITSASFTPSSGIPGSTTNVRAVISEINGIAEIEEVTLNLSSFNQASQQLSLAPSTTDTYELNNLKIPLPMGIGSYSFDLKVLGTNGESTQETLIFNVSNATPVFSNVTLSNQNLAPEETTLDIELLIQDANGGADISTSTAFADLSKIGGSSQQSFALVGGSNQDSLSRLVKVLGLMVPSGISAGTKTIDFIVQDKNGGQATTSQNVFVVDVPTELENALFSPQNILANGSDPTTLSVRVIDLNGFSNLQVYTDLSVIGMSIKEKMYDDGTHGDLISGDGIYTLNQIKAINYTPAGNYQVTITAQEGSAKKTITTILSVEEASEVQIKNIVPSLGTISGNQVVLLTASSTSFDFKKNIPNVTFIKGGEMKVAQVLGVNSANQVFVKTPNFSAGYVDVRISIGTQSISRKNGYKYVAESEIKSLELIPLPLTLNEGDNSRQMVIKTKTPVNTDTVITLLSTDTSRLTLPTSVTIPSGYTQVAFSVTTLRDTDTDDNYAIAYAGATNYLSATGLVKIVDLNLPVLTISPSSVSVFEGMATSVVVNLGKAMTTNTLVKLTSGNQEKLTISPTSINVPAGSTVAQFTLEALVDSDDKNEVVVITAEAGTSFVSTTSAVNISDKDDLTPPTVSSVNPTNGSTGINTQNNIVLTFSEALAEDSISSNVSLLSGTTVVSAIITYNNTNFTVTIDPVSDLSRGVTYTVKVLTGIKDKNENGLISEYQSSFTTQSTTSSSSRRKRRSSRRSSSSYLYNYYTPSYNLGAYNQYTPYNQTTPYSPYNQNYYNPTTPSNQLNPGSNTSYQSGSRAEYIKNLLTQNGIALEQGGTSSFRDVRPDNPYYIYIVTAEKLGLIQGYGNGTFRPNSQITPEEMNKINSLLFRR